MAKNRVTNAVQVSIDADNLQWSWDFSKENKDHGVLFTLGIHPSSWADDNNLKKLSSFINRVMSSEDSGLLFGIGECGLDFYIHCKLILLPKC